MEFTGKCFCISGKFLSCYSSIPCALVLIARDGKFSYSYVLRYQQRELKTNPSPNPNPKNEP